MEPFAPQTVLVLVRRFVGLLLGVLGILAALALPAPAQTDDPRLDAALAAFDAGDDALAKTLLSEAEAAAETPEAIWALAEARASIAHLSADDAAAVALLEPLLEQGAAQFGPEDPRLIPALRMLGAALSVLGAAAESSRAALRAARIGRASGQMDLLLPVLSDLARDRVDADDRAAAALIAAEMLIYDSADDGSLGPFAQEGAALWALALLRAGQPDAGLARLLPLLRLPGEDLAEDIPDLLAIFDEEAQVADEEAFSAWADRAKAQESARQDSDLALIDGLAALTTAYEAGDPVAADAAGRAALLRVALDDPIVTSSYYALLLITGTAGRPDLAATWAERLAAMPPAYLASLNNDPLPVLERSADWLLNQGRSHEAIALSEAITALVPLREGPQALVVGQALARLATAYRDAGRAAEAEAMFQRALAAKR